MPPTSLGYALLMISSISILSCLIGFYSQISQFCYITHVSLLVASSIGQLLGILALFTKEKSSLSMLRSPRDPRESKLLVRVECGVLMAMFVMQMGVFILSCAVHRHSCCQQRKIEMTTGNAAAAAADVKSKEMQGEIDKIKYGKLTKNDHLEA